MPTGIYKRKPLSEGHKRKIGAANKGKKASEETRRKLSAAHKGKKHSKEALKRILEYVMSHELAPDGKCDIKSQKGVECFIYRGEENDIIWLILFDNPPTRITAIIGVKDGKETVLWSDAIWQQRHPGTKKRRLSKK